MLEKYHLALPKGHVIGKYKLERVLGSGGFAITYLAVDTNLDRKVAIKELMPSDLAIRLPDLSVAAKSPAEKESFEWARHRFLDEARNIARFEHPNLVRVFEHFELNQTAYIVMSYVEGDDLNEYLKGVVPAPVETLVKLVDPLLGALRVMHRSGFLHRDIKPDNIRITPEGVPILIDFGSARHAIGSKTRDLTTILTPRYAPFEQYSEKGNLGPWTDLYSLACVIHKTLRGKAPPEATERERNDPYVPLYGDIEFAEYPGTFLQAVDAALHPHEGKRPQSAEEWRGMLWLEVDLPTGYTRIPSGKNVSVGNLVSEPTTIREAQPIPRTKKLLSPFLVLLAILACITIIGGIWMLATEKKEPAKPLALISPLPDPGSGSRKEPASVGKAPPAVTPAPDADSDKPRPNTTNESKPESETQFTALGAADLYRQADRLLLDIAVSQVKRNSSADSLDGYNKGIDRDSWDARTLEAVKASIAARDKEIETFARDSISSLESLSNWPEVTRRQGFEIRDKELIVAKAVEKIDTDLQRSLLHVFRDFEMQTSTSIKLNTTLIKERVWETKLKNSPKQ